MGLTGFNRARRQAAELAQVPVDGMSYDTAIAILTQPLLNPPPPPALELPALEDGEPTVPELPVASEPAKPPARKTTKKTVE